MTRQADVVVAVYGGPELTARCLESVLASSGDALARLIIVDDASPDGAMSEVLQSIWRRDARVRLLRNERNLGFVRSANRGLLLRERDVVLLNSDTEVTPGWLDELLAIAAEEPRVAAVGPLSNHGGLSSVPELDAVNDPALLRSRDLELERLPRFTEMPTAMGFCLLLKHEVLGELGALDPIYGRGYNEENDWCFRARARGYRVLRANRVVVLHHGGASFGAERHELERRNALVLWSRFPNFLRDTEAFRRTADARLAADHVRRTLRRPEPS